jgi:hypothetical protein
MGFSTGPCQTDEQNGQAGSIEEEADVVDLLDLLPSRLIEVVLGTGRREVEQYCSNG